MSTTNNWYFSSDDYNPLEDMDQAEQVEAQIFVEKFKLDAPAGFVYEEPDADNPFGSWKRENDEFGGTSVMIHPAVGSDATNYDYPDNFEMWVYAGEGMELASLPADWSQVDKEIRDTMKAWDQPNPYGTDNN